MIKKKNYYIAQVLFESGHKTVLALETCYIDEELVISTIQSWSRVFIGLELKVLGFNPCDFCDFEAITTKISW